MMLAHMALMTNYFLLFDQRLQGLLRKEKSSEVCEQIEKHINWIVSVHMSIFCDLLSIYISNCYISALFLGCSFRKHNKKGKTYIELGAQERISSCVNIMKSFTEDHV